MRILANENVPLLAIEALRSAGHDVDWIRALHPGYKDEQVLALAQSDDRVVLTFDKDFGELAFHRGLPASSGVILLRFEPSSVERVSEIIITALEQPISWIGNFVVISEDRIRVTPIR